MRKTDEDAVHSWVSFAANKRHRNTFTVTGHGRWIVLGIVIVTQGDDNGMNCELAIAECGITVGFRQPRRQYLDTELFFVEIIV